VLTQDHNQATAHYQVLKQAELHAPYHPFVIARVMGCRLLYKPCVSSEPIERELHDIYRWSSYFSSPTKIQFWVFPFYQFMVSDHLNLAGLVEHSAAILNNIPIRKYQPWQSEANYLEAFAIVQTIANSHQMLFWNGSSSTKAGLHFACYFIITTACKSLLPFYC